MLGITANYFVPDRVLHGYGLTPNVVDIVAARTPKPNLIVTVDNGISSVAAVDRARELGIDVIITAHHLPGAELPRPQAIGLDLPVEKSRRRRRHLLCAARPEFAPSRTRRL